MSFATGVTAQIADLGAFVAGATGRPKEVAMNAGATGFRVNQIIMGGDVNGNRMHGHYPTSLSNAKAPSSMGGYNLDTGRGRLIPTTSVDEMSAELAMWYGVANDNNMEQILPNIRNFSQAVSAAPVGFLNI